MENDIPKETLYAILIAASLDETSAFYGKDPGWIGELEQNKTLLEKGVDNSI